MFSVSKDNSISGNSILFICSRLRRLQNRKGPSVSITVFLQYRRNNKVTVFFQLQKMVMKCNYATVKIVMTELKDPLGNMIFIPPDIAKGNEGISMSYIMKTIINPAFIIRVKNKALYFFLMVYPELNLMIEVKQTKGAYIADGWVKNPSAHFISTLLNKGHLISYL
jgi:hypothetical protein